MRVDDGEASRLARAMAQAEQQAAPGDTSAEVLRYRMGLALIGSIEAMEPLFDAAGALIAGDPGMMGPEESPLPDEQYVSDLLQAISISQAKIGDWLAALQGRPLIERLMSHGPAEPGVAAGPGEVSRALVGRRLLLWLDTTPEFDPEAYASLVEKHGPLFHVMMTPMGAVTRVSTLTGDGPLELTIPADEAEDATSLHPRLVEAAFSLRNGVELGKAMAGTPVQLADPRTGERYTMAPNGTLFDHARHRPLPSWPEGLELHRFFEKGSPEPPAGQTDSVWVLGKDGLDSVYRVPFERLPRDRRDHDCDLWRSGGVQQTWREISADAEIIGAEVVRGREHG